MELSRSFCAGIVQLVLTACIAYASDDIDSADHDSEEWSGTKSYVAVIVTVASLVSIFVFLIVCAFLCPRRRGGDGSRTMRMSDNPDVFFNDVAIGRPPVVNFPMYPPVETAPEESSATVYFEPLPDVAAKAAQLQQLQASAALNAARLRPKISVVSQERADSGGDCDAVDMEISHWCDAAYEQAKLERLLTGIQRVNARQQFPRSQLQYIRELGSGWFGKVLQGEGNGILPGYKKTKVVIQMLREDSDQHDQFIFLQEGASYRLVDSPNVLKLLGQCVETAPYLTILELCSLGDLKTYLRGQLSSVESLDSQGLLLNFGCDMAAGLQALHQNSFVHRDFAIRNCLVSADMTIKVGDYGLAEELFNDDYMYDASGNAIPVRWLAPECVEFSSDAAVSLKCITKESNLWSFGVALWEVFTCGDVPYGGLSNENVLRRVIKDGSVRLAQPDLPVTNVDRLYQLMQMCWQDSPGSRASLRELRIMLLHLHSSSRGDPDTASFDQKWNQLMPRPLLPNAEDPSTGSGNNSVRSQTVDIVDIDLGTISGGSTQPAGFVSDFSELNASPNRTRPPVTSGSFSVNADDSNAKSPVNEMSLAAELGALGTFAAPHSDESNTEIEYMHENATAHISVLAEVHSQKSDTEQPDSLNVPLSESVDITDQFSSLNAEPFSSSSVSQAQTYASYLKTVHTSVIEGDEDMADDPKSKDLLSSEAVQNSDPDIVVDVINDSP